MLKAVVLLEFTTSLQVTQLFKVSSSHPRSFSEAEAKLMIRASAEAAKRSQRRKPGISQGCRQT